jgi:hypothetical protein
MNKEVLKMAEKAKYVGDMAIMIEINRTLIELHNA